MTTVTKSNMKKVTATVTVNADRTITYMGCGEVSKTTGIKVAGLGISYINLEDINLENGSWSQHTVDIFVPKDATDLLEAMDADYIERKIDEAINN